MANKTRENRAKCPSQPTRKQGYTLKSWCFCPNNSKKKQNKGNSN